MTDLTTAPLVKMIHINVSGPTGSGKSAVLASIKKMLEENHNLCVVTPMREERHNPSENINDAAPHERPKPDSTVVALTESRI